MDKSRTVAIIQARMTSTRLPGKVLLPLGAGTILDCVLTRVAAADGIDAICVAIPEGAAHDEIALHVARHASVALCRGSEDDVLSRYQAASSELSADRIIRVTSDCPMIDPRVISTVVAMQHASGAQYVATALESGFPIGCDAEVFTREALEAAHSNSSDSYEREHVTAYFWRRPEQFSTL